MDYTIVEVPDMNDSISRITILGKVYHLRFTWNDTGSYWMWGLYDSLSNPIRIGMKIVPSYPLNIFWGTDEMPDVLFGVMTEQETVGRNSFVDGEAKFIFAPLS